MKIFGRKQIQVLFTVCLLGFTSVSTAAIIIDGGPDWPGAADTSGWTWNPSGPIAGTGGNTVDYPNIANSNVENLYFGMWDNAGSYFSANDGGASSPNEEFKYHTSGIHNGKFYLSYWNEQMCFLTVTGCIYKNAFLTLTANSGVDAIIEDATTQGMGTDVGALFHLDLINPFSVTRTITMGFLEGQSGLSYYDSLSQPCCVPVTAQASVSSGFYWQDKAAVVPEPSIIALLLAGLFGIGFARIRQ